MAETVAIPRLNDAMEKRPNEPGWYSVIAAGSHRRERPIIRCMCGEVMGIGDHHVHTDGRVTASFYDRDGCGWHVFLKLLDYNQGEFPPEGKPMRKASTREDGLPNSEKANQE